MRSAMLSYGGWIGLHLFVLCYVRRVVLDRSYFAAPDSEQWGTHPKPTAAEDGRADRERIPRMPAMWSFGMPA
jgi:hypothetical protein